MQNLKFKDIKKFLLSGEEKVCVVVDKTNNYVTLLSMDGLMGDVPINAPIKYSATRLDPKYRTQLEKLAELKRSEFDIDVKIRKLNVEKEKQKEKFDKELSKMMKERGVVASRHAAVAFKERLKKNRPKLYDKMFGEQGRYDDDAHVTPAGVWIQYTRYEYFDKWVSEGKYDFVDVNYEGYLEVSGVETKAYKELCKKYSKDDVKFTMSDLKGKFQSKSAISAGDKRSLVYSHTISILIPSNNLTTDYMDKLISTIKY